MVRKTKEEAEQTKNAILDAALKVFCSKGYSRTTFDDIASSINLTKGAVYWHFKNKVDLLAEVIRKNFYNKHCKIQAWGENVQTLDDLKEMQIKIANIVVEDENYRKFLFFVLFHMEWSEAIVKNIGPLIKEIRDLPLQEQAKKLEYLKNKGEICEDADTFMLAKALRCSWNGALSYAITSDELLSFPSEVGVIFDLIFDGFRTKGK